MKTILEKYLPVLPFVTFAMIAIQLFVTWCFVRFVHYDSQYQTLPKDAYIAEVITPDDYTKLQNPSLKEVDLSNGTKILDRQPSWYANVLPNYKRVGDHYIHVTTVGTAHYYHRWMTDMMPLVLLTVWGLFVTQWDFRRRRNGASPD